MSFRGKENSFLGPRTQCKITRCASCHFSLVSVNQEWLLCSLSPVTLILLKRAGQLFVEYPFVGACFFPHIGLNHLLLWFLSNRGFSNYPSSLSVQSFIAVWIRGILFYSARYRPLLTTCVNAQTVSDLAKEDSFRLPPMFFGRVPIVCWLFLVTFWYS